MSINMIYLIGMMGSGKSTIGKQAASIAGLPFYDADYLIEQKLGLTISAVFEKYGEERFRQSALLAVRFAFRPYRGRRSCGFHAGAGLFHPCARLQF